MNIIWRCSLPECVTSSIEIILGAKLLPACVIQQATALPFQVLYSFFASILFVCVKADYVDQWKICCERMAILRYNNPDSFLYRICLRTGYSYDDALWRLWFAYAVTLGISSRYWNQMCCFCIS